MRVDARTRMFGPYSAAEKALLEPVVEFAVGDVTPQGEFHWTRTTPAQAPARPATVLTRKRMVS